MIMLPFFMAINVKAQDSLAKKNDFKQSGKLSGYLFGDYAYKLHADEYNRGSQQYSGLPKDYNSFNIRRIYLQYDYRFSPKISSDITLAHESSFEANPSKTDILSDQNKTLYLKYAYIQVAGIIPKAIIVFGQQATPTFARLSEGFWGYRSVEKTIADMRGISGSNDLGIGIYGKMGKSERFGYDFLVGNNNGSKLANSKSKKIYSALYSYFFHKKLVAQVNYEYNRAFSFPGVQGNTQLVKAFIGYKTKKTTLGLEAFRQFHSNNVRYVPETTPSDTLITNSASTGISFFYTQNILPEKLNLFARIDFYNPDVAYNSDQLYLNGYSETNETFATLGVDYQLFKNIHIMPNFWLNQYQNKTPNTTGDLRHDYDLVGRLTVYYSFNK